MRTNSCTALASTAGALLLLAGCGQKPTIVLLYDRPAQYDVPARIRRLGIADFAGRGREDRRWADAASDKLAAGLDACSRRFHRYELVERRRLMAVMDSRGPRILVLDAPSAVRLGKLAEVDAMIYGSVNVVSREERSIRRVFDPVHRTTRLVPHVKRYGMATVHVTMDEVATGNTLASVTATRDYDSDADERSGGSFARLLKTSGGGGQRPPPTDQIVSRLLDQCVEEFLAKVSPHEVRFEEELASVTTDVAGTGNKLALAGEYKDALERYLEGLREKPDDHGALFNAGLMHEAMARDDPANLAKADAFYDKAIAVKPDPRYIAARKRVRTERKD